MATFVSTKLAFGQVAASKTAIASPSGTKWLIHEATFHNETASPVTVQLYYNDGTSRRVHAFDVPGDDTVSLDWRGNGFVVEDGEDFEAEASAATSINYSLDGAVRTP